MPQMMIRRGLGRLALALSLATVLGRTAQADPATSAAFVHTLGDRLVAVVNESAPAAQKRDQLRPIIDQNIAVDDIARFCLGRYYPTATPAQQQQYVELFHTVLLNSIVGHLGSYRGVSFRVGRATAQADGDHVETTIFRPGESPTDVEWVIAPGTPKVVDVVAEGTSLRQTQRGDYTSYLDRHGGSVPTLIAALTRQVSHFQPG